MNNIVKVLSIIKMLFVYLFIIVLLIIIKVNNDKIKEQESKISVLIEEIEQYKQAANPSKEIIDSLSYNIKYRDSIIYNIKYKYLEDVKTIKNISDSSTVNLFKELVWTD